MQILGSPLCHLLCGCVKRGVQLFLVGGAAAADWSMGAEVFVVGRVLYFANRHSTDALSGRATRVAKIGPTTIATQAQTTLALRTTNEVEF